jgi:hypothetical protein
MSRRSIMPCRSMGRRLWGISIGGRGPVTGRRCPSSVYTEPGVGVGVFNPRVDYRPSGDPPADPRYPPGDPRNPNAAAGTPRTLGDKLGGKGATRRKGHESCGGVRLLPRSFSPARKLERTVPPQLLRAERSDSFGRAGEVTQVFQSTCHTIIRNVLRGVPFRSRLPLRGSSPTNSQSDAVVFHCPSAGPSCKCTASGLCREPALGGR